MSRIELLTIIRAPIERVFDLSRSIDMHVASTDSTKERAIAGVTSGLIGPGQEVTWRARHLGVWQELTSRITAFDRPNHFRDSMVRGAFRRFDHDHHFAASGDGTEMRDVFDFTAPGGWLGRGVERLVLTPYLRRLLLSRNRMIQHVAESEEWRQYLTGANQLFADFSVIGGGGNNVISNSSSASL